MKQVDKPVASDAEWYFRRDPEYDTPKERVQEFYPSIPKQASMSK